MKARKIFGWSLIALSIIVCTLLLALAYASSDNISFLTALKEVGLMVGGIAGSIALFLFAAHLILDD